MRLTLGVTIEEYSYELALGLPSIESRSPFSLDAEVKEEFVWIGPKRTRRTTLLDRAAATATARDVDGAEVRFTQLPDRFEPALAQLREPARFPELHAIGAQLRRWRFYHHFPTGPDAPARNPRPGVRTPVLADDGADLAAALATIEAMGNGPALHHAIGEAFPNAQLQIAADQGVFALELSQPGLARPLRALERLGAHGHLVARDRARSPGALWCGTIPGGLFRSDDRAASWQLVESLWNDESRVRWNGGGADQPAVHSICVDPRDPAQVAIAVSSGGVWRTRDAGRSWEAHTRGMVAGYVPPEQSELPENQDPHCVVQSDANPEVFWCQHHMGIWRSDNDLASWTELHTEPSSFGFPVAVHPYDADTAWFVPAHSDQKRTPIEGRVVVTRTRDGGKSFDVLTNGLPQANAYDLVLRHALDVDASGSHLAFGSTTGNLFTTADGGDRWHAVANHLPPIYSVRYA